MTANFMFGSEKSAYAALVHYVNLPEPTENDYNHVVNKMELARDEAGMALVRLINAPYEKGKYDEVGNLQERRNAWQRALNAIYYTVTGESALGCLNEDFCR